MATIHSEEDLQKKQEIFKALNETKIQDPTGKTPDSWLYSDLCEIYPNFLHKDNQIPVESFSDKLHETIIQRVPQFEFRIEKPTHIKTIEIKNKADTNTSASKPLVLIDQQLSRLACEYLFKQYYDTEFTQSYFLFPECNFFELLSKANDMKYYRTQQGIYNIITIFAAIILRTTKRSKASVYDALNVTWSTFFNTDDFAAFRELYNIDHSPLDHFHPDQWKYIYNMFKNIAAFIDPHSELELEEVREECREVAKHARHLFEKYDKEPEKYMSKTDFSVPAREIDMARKQFWIDNYTKSL